MATPKKRTTGKKTQASKKKAANSKVNLDSCFVIMPFSGWFDDYYTSIYAPAISAAGLAPNRADDLYRPSTIVSDIWDYTRKAKLILADLSGKNANVFYELGLAHALAKPAILVVESMDDIPFDLRALRVLEYDKNDPNWGNILQQKIEQAIAEVLTAPHLSVPAAFIGSNHPQKSVTLTSQEKEMLEMRQELDLLRHRIDIARSGNRMLPSSEAKIRIQRYQESGLPDDRIVTRMSDFGVPERYVRMNLDRFRQGNQKSIIDDLLAATPPPKEPARKKEARNTKK